ncbi:unnamed protein product [Lampetra fluviatilis]
MYGAKRRAPQPRGAGVGGGAAVGAQPDEVKTLHFNQTERVPTRGLNQRSKLAEGRFGRATIPNFPLEIFSVAKSTTTRSPSCFADAAAWRRAARFAALLP